VLVGNFCFFAPSPGHPYATSWASIQFHEKQLKAPTVPFKKGMTTVSGRGNYPDRAGHRRGTIKKPGEAVKFSSATDRVAKSRTHHGKIASTSVPTAGRISVTVQRVLAHYGEQTDDEASAEDEVGIRPSETVMNVPHDLVSKVRELIAKQNG
jgi:hypothetical protein